MIKTVLVVAHARRLLALIDLCSDKPKPDLWPQRGSVALKNIRKINKTKRKTHAWNLFGNWVFYGSISVYLLLISGQENYGSAPNVSFVWSLRPIWCSWQCLFARVALWLWTPVLAVSLCVNAVCSTLAVFFLALESTGCVHANKPTWRSLSCKQENWQWLLLLLLCVERTQPHVMLWRVRATNIVCT